MTENLMLSKESTVQSCIFDCLYILNIIILADGFYNDCKRKRTVCNAKPTNYKINLITHGYSMVYWETLFPFVIKRVLES